MSRLGNLYEAIPLALETVFDGFAVYDHEPSHPELPGVWPGLFERVHFHHDLGGGLRIEQPITIAVGRADEHGAQVRLWEAIDPAGPLSALERYQFRVPTSPWRSCAVLNVDKPYALIVGDSTALAVDVAVLFIV